MEVQRASFYNIFVCFLHRTASTSKLVELDLGYNEIKDDGACALAQVCCSVEGHG